MRFNYLIPNSVYHKLMEEALLVCTSLSHQEMKVRMKIYP
jgi:hypothetical protein